jgi:hypothetical protein
VIRLAGIEIIEEESQVGILDQHFFDMIVNKVKKTVHATVVLDLPDFLNQSNALTILYGLRHCVAHQELRVNMAESAPQHLLCLGSLMLENHLSQHSYP